MVHFDGYRWQDHRARPGRWKVDLAVTVLSIGLLFGVGHEAAKHDFLASSSVAGQQSSEMPVTAKSISRLEAISPGPEITTPRAIYPAVLPVDVDGLGSVLCDLSHSLDRATSRLRSWVAGTSHLGKAPQA